MPQIITTTVFTIDELSDTAKEAARSWYRDQGIHDDWHDYIFDDFQTICRIIGITLSTHPVRLYGGGTREEPNIWYRGFWSQGDGACYEGQYSHAPGAAKALRAHAPKDTELHDIIDTLQDAQRRNFFQLHSTIRRQGRYSHANCMMIDVERDSPTWQPITEGADDTVVVALRHLAHWLYRQLRNAYEAETSDYAIDEALHVNQWTFTASGKRFG
ncbi:MAG: antitoxin of toxin-antitoxin stability system [Chloroflexi bacterium]|nr:antitoxin of toxin-antitoxin stability system [Chloroflexota bacterium]